MKTSYYQKDFNDYDDAFEFMQLKNKAFKKAGNMSDCLAVVPGAENNYSVVDDRTAIELGLGYVVSYGNGWICNPFL